MIQLGDTVDVLNDASQQWESHVVVGIHDDVLRIVGGSEEKLQEISRKNVFYTLGRWDYYPDYGVEDNDLDLLTDLDIEDMFHTWEEDNPDYGG